LLAEVVKLLTARIVEMQQSLDSERGKNSLLETEVEWLLSEAKKYSFMRMCFNYIESFTEKPNQVCKMKSIILKCNIAYIWSVNF
jgi:hypothetical protein